MHRVNYHKEEELSKRIREFDEIKIITGVLDINIPHPTTHRRLLLNNARR